MFNPKKFKYTLVCLMMISSFPIHTEAIQFLSNKDYKKLDALYRDGVECQKLCIGKILTKCLKAKHLVSEALDSENVHANMLCSDSINTDRLCANIINVAQQICAPSFTAPVICAEQVTATNLCASGLVQVNTFQQCGRYRATATFSADTAYTLGTFIPFDTILDDPNGNTNTSPFAYSAPLAGYYIVTLQINQNSLIGSNSIVGIPVGNLQILVNGNTFRETYAPYLSFHNEQKLTVSALVSLQAGDIVEAHYHVYVMNDTTGFTPYIGSAIIEGNGAEGNSSIFKIHYLSSDCTSTPCTPCQTTCTPTPCNLPCDSCAPCHNMSCCDDN